MIRRSLYLAAAALCALSASAAAELLLVSSDERSAVFEYRTGSPGFSPAPGGLVRLSLDGASLTGSPGQPGLPGCVAHIAVPEGSSVRAEVIGSRPRDFTGIRLAPVPHIAFDESGIDRESFLPDPAAYASAALLPAELARVESVSPLRQLTVARISLRPAQHAPAAGLLRVHTALTVRVSWSGGKDGGAAVDDQSFQPLLERLVLNYPAARGWAAAGGHVSARDGDPFDAAPLWYKVSVARDGVHRLSYTDLRLSGVNPDLIDPRTVKLFTAGSSALPKSHAAAFPDSMYQAAIRVEGEEDGRFGPDDRILFYGQGMNGWRQNRLLPNGQYNNPYDSVNCYWLCWGGAPGLRMATRDGQPVTPGAAQPLAFTDTAHFELDRVNPFNSGELWFWQHMARYGNEQVRRFTFPFFVPYVSSDQAQARVNLLSGTAATSHNLRWGINGTAVKDFAWTGSPAAGQRTDQAAVSGLAGGQNTLDIDLVQAAAGSSDAVLLNWFEIVCQRPYQAHNRQLAFRADPAHTGQVRFRLTGLLSDRAALLDVTDPDRPVWITTPARFAAYTEFEDAAAGRRYFCAAPESWLTPLAVQAWQPQRLRQTMLGTKYLVVAADELWPQAQALAGYHSTQPGKHPARAVKLSAVYDEFGFGLRDPSALRNFLRHIYLNSAPARTSPAWCCLLGDGSYDYRWIDRSSPDQDLVPSHQADILKYDNIGEYLFSANDDWFARVDSTYPQFVVGRIPARNAAEAWSSVNKSIGYNQRNGLGPWRNRAVLMADDAYKRAELTNELQHTNQTESIGSAYLPSTYDLRKVYGEMQEFPLSSQETKPAATEALLRQWDEGAAVVHFTGHGAWFVWGHEQYFRYTDVPKLANSDRLPLVVMASCGTSRYDNPSNEAIGSALVVRQGGGAVATIGAMRETTDGISFAQNFYSRVFASPDNDMGQAFFGAKFNIAEQNLNSSFVLLGDPSLRHVKPAGLLTLAVSSDTLLSRGRYTVSGAVGGGTIAAGQVQVALFDVARRDSTGPYGIYGYCKFTRPGKLLFQGLAPVRNDSFSLSFNVPDLLHSTPAAGARISAYAWSGPTDAAGVSAGTVWIGGADTTRPNDRRGPAIEVAVNGLPVAGGDTVDPAARITVRITDPLGINIAPGVAEGEIRIRFDNGDYSDLSQQFLYESGSDSSGTVSLTKAFGDGRHTIRVEAYDCHLNRAVWEQAVIVAGTQQLKVDHVYNYPNPFADRTWFTFNIRQAADVTIRVYTVAGRLIRTIESPALAAGYNQVRWDGLDGDGDRPANGVYLYKVTAKNASGEDSAFGRLTVMR